MKRWVSLLRRTAVLFVVLAFGLAAVLFTVKYQVQALEIELADLERAIDAERRAKHVLEAEWSYLTDAERLRRLTGSHLDLAPVAPRQIGSFALLSQPLEAPASPPRHEDAPVQAAPRQNTPLDLEAVVRAALAQTTEVR